MKIYVYAISKNEEKFAGRWYNSMREADGVYVLDTGSTDSTVHILQNLGAYVETRQINPWRFDIARNRSLELVPECDLCVCTDLDEVFHNGWRSKLEHALSGGDYTTVRYRYTWNFNHDGSEGTVFYIAKAHKRHGFKWINPVHEVLKYDGVECICTVEGLQLDHHADNTKPRSSYLPLLELAVDEDPDNDRNMHYLGREYMFHGQYDKAIHTLKKHLAMPSAVWRDERCASMRFIARCGEEREMWLLRACAEAPHTREPWVETAGYYYERKDWPGVIFFSERALQITTRPTTYINEPQAWGSYPSDILSIAYWHSGDRQNALRSARLAVAADPGNGRIRQNLRFFEGESA